MNTAKFSKHPIISFKKINRESRESNRLSPRRNFILSEREAKAASPAAMAVCGEEDPGGALEFLVTDEMGR